jgi:hypothetical protein
MRNIKISISTEKQKEYIDNILNNNSNLRARGYKSFKQDLINDVPLYNLLKDLIKSVGGSFYNGYQSLEKIGNDSFAAILCNVEAYEYLCNASEMPDLSEQELSDYCILYFMRTAPFDANLVSIEHGRIKRSIVTISFTNLKREIFEFDSDHPITTFEWDELMASIELINENARKEEEEMMRNQDMRDEIRQELGELAESLLEAGEADELERLINEILKKRNEN